MWKVHIIDITRRNKKRVEFVLLVTRAKQSKAERPSVQNCAWAATKEEKEEEETD